MQNSKGSHGKINSNKIDVPTTCGVQFVFLIKLNNKISHCLLLGGLFHLLACFHVFLAPIINDIKIVNL